MIEPSKEALKWSEEFLADRDLTPTFGSEVETWRGLVHLLADASDKARAEEREECAKIADKHGDDEPGMHGYEPACRDIAAAIRNRADRT